MCGLSERIFHAPEAGHLAGPGSPGLGPWPACAVGTRSKAPGSEEGSPAGISPAGS